MCSKIVAIKGCKLAFQNVAKMLQRSVPKCCKNVAKKCSKMLQISVGFPEPSDREKFEEHW
jgi:hypothetical protein